MSDLSAGLAAAALFVLAGWGWIAGMTRLRRLPLGARLGWCYLVGLAWVSAASFALSQGGLAALRLSWIVGLAALPATVWALARRWRRRASAAIVARSSSGPRTAQRRLLVWACATIVTAASAGVAARMATEPLADWDGRMTWAPAARWICAEGSVEPTVLTEKRWWVSHPDYPPLLPVADCVAIALASGREGGEPYRLLYALQLPALLAVTWTAAARWAGRRAAWLAAAIVALAPFPVWNPDGGATGAYSDLGLAALFGGGLVLLAGTRRLSEGLLGGLLLAAAAMTKNEGAWLAAGALAACALTALFGARSKRHGTRRPWLAAALLVGVALLLLHGWTARIPPRGDESYAVLLRQQNLAGAMAGLWRAAPAALRQMASPSSWSLLWWVAPLLLLLGHRGWMRRRYAALLVGAALPLALGAAAYALHPGPERLVAVTWNRFLVQALVPAAILLALALRSALRREAPARGGPTAGVAEPTAP